MRAHIDQGILYLHQDDVPHYKKSGSVVRNSFFWALRSIADRALFNQDWEFAEEVWPALTRMLTSFAEAGYLGYVETMLEFAEDAEIPPILKPMATWVSPEDEEDDDEI